MGIPVKPPRIEVVVTRFREDVGWTRNVPDDVAVTVYDKGGTTEGATVLPNIGREAQTYLHHIVSRFGSLADWTFFVQGHPFDHAPDLHRRVRELRAGDWIPDGFHWLGFMVDTDDARGERLFGNWTKNADRRGLDMDGFCRAVFGQPAPGLFAFVGGGQFVVSADRIRQRPEPFYRNALAVAGTFPDAAHCFERTWGWVFGDPGWAERVLGGEQTRYLKRVKRLEKNSIGSPNAGGYRSPLQ